MTRQRDLGKTDEGRHKRLDNESLSGSKRWMGRGGQRKEREPERAGAER
jgi:hypothetical protein